MSGQWKPGDLISVPFMRGRVRMFIRPDGSAEAEDSRYSSSAASVRNFTDVRRLVVIDPENREDVERLHALNRLELMQHPVDTLQHALREFANPKPPKPGRPTGWGAVVEDDTGSYWTLIAPEADVWRNYAEGARRYHEIAAVRVLSEGVQA